MTDHELLLKLITDLKRENEKLKEEVYIHEKNYNILHERYNKLLQEDK